MPRKTATPKSLGQSPRAGQARLKRAKIADTIAELDQLKPNSTKATMAIALFKAWLADESGYDEKVWPSLKKALEKERERVGARRLFNG